MKLLLYTHVFAPRIGGVETIVRSLARGLSEIRDSEGRPEFDLTVVTQTPRGDCDDRSFPFPVVRQPSPHQLWTLIRHSDVVHVAGPALAPIIASLIAHKPLVIEHHGFQTICPNGQLLIDPPGIPCPGHFMAGRHGECLRCNAAEGWIAARKLWLLTFVRRFASAHATVNIMPTQWLGGMLHLPRSTTVVHGIPVEPVLQRPSARKGPPLIAFQGRLVTTKGVRVLLDAACILKKQGRSFELLIIGDGPERVSLEQRAREFNLQAQVNFRGSLATDELDAALASASIVVVPSLGGEVFGLVVAENMARSLAVVASDLGAFVEVMGSAGVAFRTDDADALARQLAHLLDDPAEIVRLGQLARARVSEVFQSRRMIEHHADVYRRVHSGQVG